MAEQFCLRWNNHQSTLVSVFEKLLEQETHIDCTLWAEGRVLRAHKVVLSACSPTFESMLCVQEDKHPIIFLKDVKYVELKAMLDYMYRGEVNISQDQLDSFLKTAEALQVKGLTDQGGGTDEPPAKKGPGRKTGMSDVAPESPLVGNAPLREGSTSPGPGGKRRRRLPRRHSGEESESNDCDSLQAPAAPPQAVCPPADSAARLAPPVHHPSPAPPPPATIVKKEVTQELVTPKTEYVEENTGDIEDLTLDDDDDYGEMSKPGTSFGMAQGSTSQDFSQWQQMTDDRTRDEVFMAAQEAINNQSNAQGVKLKEINLFTGGTLLVVNDYIFRRNKASRDQGEYWSCPECLCKMKTAFEEEGRRVVVIAPRPPHSHPPDPRLVAWKTISEKAKIRAAHNPSLSPSVIVKTCIAENNLKVNGKELENIINKIRRIRKKLRRGGHSVYGPVN